VVLNGIAKDIGISLHEDHITIGVLAIGHIVTVNSIELLEVIFLDHTWIMILQEWWRDLAHHIDIKCRLIIWHIIKSKSIATLDKRTNIFEIKVS
jgi:hypothetical protein